VVNLADDTQRVAEAVSLSDISTKNIDFLIEFCCQMHQIYADFSRPFVTAMIK